MVNITGLTDDEIALIEKTSRLVQITEEVLGLGGLQRIDSSLGYIHIKHRSPQASGHPISVSPRINQISVESKEYFDEARKLAEAYEAAFPEGGEFELKPLYRKAPTS